MNRHERRKLASTMTENLSLDALLQEPETMQRIIAVLIKRLGGSVAISGHDLMIQCQVLSSMSSDKIVMTIEETGGRPMQFGNG